MLEVLRTVGWLVCLVYSTIPFFWLLIHTCADYWRSRKRSPYFILLPLWIAMWIVLGFLTAPWRHIALYTVPWTSIPAVLLFATGIWIYSQSVKQFSRAQLGGLPEVVFGHGEQRLVTVGIRSRVRHPVYLGHLCEMLAWSIGTGLIVCWLLTGLAVATGAVMIRMEDAELEKRFGDDYRKYRSTVPAVLPHI